MRDQLVTSQLVAHWLRNWLHSWSPLSNVDNTKVVHANMLRNVSKHQSKLFLRSGGIHSCILVLFGRSVSLVALVTSTGCTGYITGRAGYISWSRWLHPLVALVTSAGRAGYITGRTGYINWLHWLHQLVALVTQLVTRHRIFSELLELWISENFGKSKNII